MFNRWKSNNAEDETVLKSNTAMCVDKVEKVVKQKCTTTINGRPFSFDHGRSWSKYDECNNRCTCGSETEGVVTCTANVCTACTKTKLVTLMNTNKLQHYYSYYEKYVQDSNAAGRSFYLKCKDTFTHVKSRRELTSIAPPTYAQRFRVVCKPDGNWEDASSNCESSPPKPCQVTPAGGPNVRIAATTVAHGEKFTFDCNSCTCNDGTCDLTTVNCVTCPNVKVTELATENKLTATPLRGESSPKNAKVCFCFAIY